MPTIEDKLVQYLQEAHAMERNVLEMLDSMISTTEDPEIVRELEHHKQETERHEASIGDCLEAHGKSPSPAMEVPALFGATMKGLMDKARKDKPIRNGRDGFVTEHAEIAVYEVLERLAMEVGDQKTVETARQNRADEESMAQKISSNWDKFVKLALQEEGVSGS